MKLRKNQLFWGWVAAVTLAVWFSAQFVCARHCASGQVVAGAEAGHGCCKKGEDAGADSSGAMPDGGCFVFKTAPTSAPSQWVAPMEFWQPLLAVVFVSLDSVVSIERVSLERPVAPERCVIAHEVSLGSAAHSLAPPLV